MTETHDYKVGMGSGVEYIRAPNATAAAIFYGVTCVNTNNPCAAAVYEMDGEPYEGESPWLGWAFGGESPTDEELEAIKKDLDKCQLLTVELVPA